MKIFKYPILVTDVQSLEMPAGAKVLSIAEQHERVCIWALVDPSAPIVLRRLVIHGTGHQADDIVGMQFVGTFISHGGTLVFHAFIESPWIPSEAGNA